MGTVMEWLDRGCGCLGVCAVVLYLLITAVVWAVQRLV
jgi:hypothetical protein